MNPVMYNIMPSLATLLWEETTETVPTSSHPVPHYRFHIPLFLTHQLHITIRISTLMFPPLLYVFFTDDYLGDQRYSYNRFLTFTFRVGEDGSRVSREDIIIEGAGFRISAPIYSQGNPQPSSINQVK